MFDPRYVLNTRVGGQSPKDVSIMAGISSNKAFNFILEARTRLAVDDADHFLAVR